MKKGDLVKCVQVEEGSSNNVGDLGILLTPMTHFPKVYWIARKEWTYCDGVVFEVLSNDHKKVSG